MQFPLYIYLKFCSCYVDEKTIMTRAASDETDDDYSDDDTESDDTDVDNYTESRVTTTTGRYHFCLIVHGSQI